MTAAEKTVASLDSEGYRVAGDLIRPVTMADSTNAYEAFVVTAVENNGPPPHSHDWRELYYMIDGEIDLIVDGVTTRLKPGEFARVPAGAVHLHRVVSANARFMFIVDPSGAVAFFEEIDRETQGSCEDVAKIVSIAQRHGFRIG